MAKKKEKYMVLSSSQKKATSFVVEKKNITKNQAKIISKNLSGFWCGVSPGSTHRKYRGKKIPKNKSCYRLYTKIVKQ